jgi:hypothetical protein
MSRHRSTLPTSLAGTSATAVPNINNFCPRACNSRQEAGTLIRKPRFRKVVYLPVGIRARIVPKGSTLWGIAAGGLNDAGHGDILQIFLRVAGAAREVGGHGGGNVAMLQSQRIGGGMGLRWTMAPRLGGEGDHQLNSIDLLLGSRIQSRTDPNALSTAGPRQTCRPTGGRSGRSSWPIATARQAGVRRGRAMASVMA